MAFIPGIKFAPELNSLSSRIKLVFSINFNQFQSISINFNQFWTWAPAPAPELIKTDWNWLKPIDTDCKWLNKIEWYRLQFLNVLFRVRMGSFNLGDRSFLTIVYFRWFDHLFPFSIEWLIGCWKIQKLDIRGSN